MSGKTRYFSVAGFLPHAAPVGVVAHSKIQLGRRLAAALDAPPDLVAEVACALWKGRPVFLTDLAVAILPGRFSAVSYQVLSASGAAF